MQITGCFQSASMQVNNCASKGQGGMHYTMSIMEVSDVTLAVVLCCWESTQCVYTLHVQECQLVYWFLCHPISHNMLDACHTYVGLFTLCMGTWYCMYRIVCYIYTFTTHGLVDNNVRCRCTHNGSTFNTKQLGSLLSSIIQL